MILLHLLRGKKKHIPLYSSQDNQKTHFLQMKTRFNNKNKLYKTTPYKII